MMSTLEQVFPSHATMILFRLLQAVLCLPIVGAWHATTTISASVPAGSATRELDLAQRAGPAPCTDGQQVSWARFIRRSDVPAEIPIGCRGPGREEADSTQGVGAQL